MLKVAIKMILKTEKSVSKAGYSNPAHEAHNRNVYVGLWCPAILRGRGALSCPGDPEENRFLIPGDPHEERLAFGGAQYRFAV